jgi:transcription termination factor Rho
MTASDHLEPAAPEQEEPERRTTREAARAAGTDLALLQAMPSAELAQLAGAGLAESASRQDLVLQALQHNFAAAGTAWGEGVLEVLQDGFGFLRSRRSDYRAGADDLYVSPSQVRRLHLRAGQLLAGPLRPPRPGEKYFALLHVDQIEGVPPGRPRPQLPFAALTPILPQVRLLLDREGASPLARAIDLLAPWGRGQRVLMALPPRADRLQLLHQITAALLQDRQLTVLVCLLDQRPEDAAAMRQCLADAERCELVASTFDEGAERHTALAATVLTRAQRLVEGGRHVVLVLDSLTRLVRAWHQEVPPSGRMLTAGLDAAALLQPKQLFAAARNTEEGGSLTVVATVLTATGSRIDEVIAEEFQGHGNSEVVLAGDQLPLSIDVARTGTRREDWLLAPAAAAALAALRGELLVLPARERHERLLAMLASEPRHDANLLRQRAT